jgi:hypothetical protein
MLARSNDAFMDLHEFVEGHGLIPDPPVARDPRGARDRDNDRILPGFADADVVADEMVRQLRFVNIAIPAGGEFDG